MVRLLNVSQWCTAMAVTRQRLIHLLFACSISGLAENGGYIGEMSVYHLCLVTIPVWLPRNALAGPVHCTRSIISDAYYLYHYSNKTSLHPIMIPHKKPEV